MRIIFNIVLNKIYTKAIILAKIKIIKNHIHDGYCNPNIRETVNNLLEIGSNIDDIEFHERLYSLVNDDSYKPMIVLDIFPKYIRL